MIIFIHEDRTYLNWVTHHRHGYVLDGRRRPHLRHLLLHRASCPKIRKSLGQRTNWTMGDRFKACSPHFDELQAWVVEEAAVAASLCEQCQPTVDLARDESPSCRLTKLAADILDYILDVAIIHLENKHPPYHLCCGDISACLSKTMGQLSAAMQQLVTDGLITLHGKLTKETFVGPYVVVFPTPKGLRTLEAFREQSDPELQAELRKLHPA